MTWIDGKFLLITWVVLGTGFPAWGLCVNAAQAKLRTGPGNSFPVSWVVGRNTPLVEVDEQKKGAWIPVADMDGEKHWVASSVVTNNFQCLSVRTQWARLRTGPGAQFPLADITQVDKYTPLRRFEMDNGWYQVVAPDGQKVWVNETTVWRPVKVLNVNF